MTLQVIFEETSSFMDVSFSQENTQFEIQFVEPGQFAVDFGEIYEIVSSDVPVYQDAYKVRPKLSEQTLETEGMLMREDVTVEQIPIYVVSNNSGGTTVTIGG